MFASHTSVTVDAWVHLVAQVGAVRACSGSAGTRTESAATVCFRTVGATSGASGTSGTSSTKSVATSYTTTSTAVI